jgi:Predicted hydrolases of HD superfamily
LQFYGPEGIIGKRVSASRGSGLPRVCPDSRFVQQGVFMSHSFFAYLSRLRLISRWSLMRNSVPENDAEHSLQVAMIAHAIAVIARDRYGRDVNPEHVLSLAVYHDATEVMTGDLPPPSSIITTSCAAPTAGWRSFPPTGFWPCFRRISCPPSRLI